MHFSKTPDALKKLLVLKKKNNNNKKKNGLEKFCRFSSKIKKMKQNIPREKMTILYMVLYRHRVYTRFPTSVIERRKCIIFSHYNIQYYVLGIIGVILFYRVFIFIFCFRCAISTGSRTRNRRAVDVIIFTVYNYLFCYDQFARAFSAIIFNFVRHHSAEKKNSLIDFLHRCRIHAV